MHAWVETNRPCRARRNTLKMLIFHGVNIFIQDKRGRSERVMYYREIKFSNAVGSVLQEIKEPENSSSDLLARQETRNRVKHSSSSWAIEPHGRRHANPKRFQDNLT